VRAFLELHIEQGPVLERSGKQIGIVTAVAAPTRLHIVLTGEQNHSGTTPMHMRHDALAAAAEMILAVERIANEFASQVVGTVGVIQSEPNVVNAIPGRVELRADIRSANAGAKRECVEAIRRTLAYIATKRGVEIETAVLMNEAPVEFSNDVVNAFERVCAAQNIDAMKMPSGAGHDAAHVARVAPAGMIFVPSRGGVSHDPREFSFPQEIQRGAQVLLGALLAMDAPS
jgi:hydantoinase/carbamoylase family amidase